MRKLLEELFATYHREVYNYLYSLSHDASLSEDLASEVFLQVVKSIGSFRGESDIKTWLFAIARHRWYDYLRKKKRQLSMESPVAFWDDRNADMQSPDTGYSDKELVGRIYELLDKEPERTRGIVLMRLEGYSFYEIAQKYKISESSARVIDFRAKTKIREILKKEGLGDA